jgi:hypothetical protein
MKTADTILNYLGYGIHPSQCRVMLYSGPKGPVLIASELKDNRGTSVTNAIEVVVWDACNTLGIECSDTLTVIEHYPKRGDFDESFDKVVFRTAQPDNRPFYRENNPLCFPQWSRLTYQQVVALIGEEP